MIIRMLKELRGRVNEINENLNKETVNIKKGHMNHEKETSKKRIHYLK